MGRRTSHQLPTSRRHQYQILVATVVAVFVIYFLKSRYALKPDTNWGSPPSWDTLREWELNLPQHNLDLPFPEGKNGRFIKFSIECKHTGWNNVYTELYVCSPPHTLQTSIALIMIVS